MFPERLREGRDLEREAGLLDVHVAPDDAEQFILGEEASAARHEDDEEIEGAGRKRDDRPVAREDARLRVEAKWAEAIRAVRTHRPLQRTDRVEGKSLRQMGQGCKLLNIKNISSQEFPAGFLRRS
jgi:hypothetical protein